MYLNYNHIYIHIQIYTKYEENQPSNQPTQLCFFLTFRPSNPPFSLRKSHPPRQGTCVLPNTCECFYGWGGGGNGGNYLEDGLPMDGSVVTLPSITMVQWKMVASPGRCVACLQMGYFPLNHDYGRKGRITPIYKPSFLKAIWKGSNPTGSLGDLHPSVLGAHPPRVETNKLALSGVWLGPMTGFHLFTLPENKQDWLENVSPTKNGDLPSSDVSFPGCTYLFLP